MSKKLAFLLCLATLSACAHKPLTGGAAGPNKAAAAGADAKSKRPFPETPDFWRADGKAALQRARQAPAAAPPAHNLILFIGDGMGVSTVTAARILQGQKLNPNGGEENALAFETFPATALVKTYNTDLQVPESAGSMTAMMSGVKTRGASLGLDQTPTRGQCQDAAKSRVKSLVEQAKDAGLSAGLVTNMRVTHAVPAATYAHVSDRDWEIDTRIPADARAAGCRDIARALIDFDHHGPLDVVLAGGRAAFLPSRPADLKPRAGDETRYGARGDGVDLIAAWTGKYARGRYLYARNDLVGLDWASITGPVLGLFAVDNMAPEADRVESAAGQPSLTEMTKAAITGLKRNPRGYVLVVDAGGIDWAHHQGDARKALIDTIELSNAVKAAADMTSPTDTLIVVAATNSHTLTIGGVAQRGGPILGLSRDVNGQLARDERGAPYTTLAYANGPGAPPKPPLESTPDDKRQYVAATLLDSETHGGEDTPLYASGPGAQWFHGVLEQNALYWIMSAAMNDFRPPAVPPPPRPWYKPELPKQLPKVWPFGGKDGKAPAPPALPALPKVDAPSA